MQLSLGSKACDWGEVLLDGVGYCLGRTHSTVCINVKARKVGCSSTGRMIVIEHDNIVCTHRCDHHVNIDTVPMVPLANIEVCHNCMLSVNK